MERDWEEEKKQFNYKVGNKLKMEIKSKGYRQDDFAKLLGVTTSTIFRWTNQRATPDIFYLYKASKILGISLNELLEGYLENSDNFFNREEVKKIKELIKKNEK